MQGKEGNGRSLQIGFTKNLNKLINFESVSHSEIPVLSYEQSLKKLLFMVEAANHGAG